MKAIIFLSIILSITFPACEQPHTRQKRAAMEASNIATAQKDTITDKQANEAKTKIIADSIHNSKSKITFKGNNPKELVGTWFIPHDADITITFYADSTFLFNDFNTKLNKEEQLTGKYQVTDNTLTLLYTDRTKQNFHFSKGASGDDNYYITKPGYYFVKSDAR